MALNKRYIEDLSDLNAAITCNLKDLSTDKIQMLSTKPGYGYV